MQKVMEGSLVVFKLISLSDPLSAEYHSAMESLSAGLMKRLCDIHWEVRDSAVEWLRNIFQLCNTIECKF